MPLVLHGGSGCGKANLRKAVSLGINKINVATDAFTVAKEAMMRELKKTSKRIICIYVWLLKQESSNL